MNTQKSLGHHLWSKIWYEGYKEPEFIWQSTSGSDDFEPKFSLMPLAFGTLKSCFLCVIIFCATCDCRCYLYSILYGTSLAQVVKPAVEIMEALPTVILGFLAGFG